MDRRCRSKVIAPTGRRDWIIREGLGRDWVINVLAVLVLLAVGVV